MTQLTETLLQDLLKTISTLQNDISELKKADNTTNRDISRKQPRDGEPSGNQHVTCNDKDDTSQLSDDDGSDGDPTSDVEDHKSSDTAEYFKLSEEGKTFLEMVFSSKMEYSMRKAKLAKYGQPDSKRTRCPELAQ